MAGIRMNKARTPDGWAITAEAMADSMRQGMRCEGCQAEVAWVKPHTVGEGANAITRRAHFRLKPGGTHDDGCVHDTSNRIEDIRRESEEAAEVIVRGPRQKHAEFRLNVVMEKLIELSDTCRPAGANAGANAGAKDDAQHHAVIESCRPITPYIRAASSIAKLQLQEADNADSFLCIIHDGRSIPWSDFNFAPGGYQALLENRFWTDNGFSVHPVALSITVSSIDMRGGRLRITGRTGRSAVDGTAMVLPVAYISEPSMHDQFAEGRSYIFVGFMRKNQWSKAWAEVGLYVYHQAQVTEIEI